jgi:hypothetical protein
MDRRFGYFVFVGLLIGVLFGFGTGAANGNPLLGAGFGALTGVFLGWFVAAVVQQKGKPE